MGLDWWNLAILAVFKSLRQSFEGILSTNMPRFWTYFENFPCYWKNFHCCKRPNIKNLSSHLVTLLPGFVLVNTHLSLHRCLLSMMLALKVRGHPKESSIPCHVRAKFNKRDKVLNPDPMSWAIFSQHSHTMLKWSTLIGCWLFLANQSTLFQHSVTMLR